MSRVDFIFPALIFAFVAALLAFGYWYYEYGWVTFAFPLGVGIVVCILCASEAGRVLRTEPATVAAGADVEAADDTTQPLSLPAIGWMFSLAVFLYVFGFIAGPAFYLLICLRAHGASWLVSAGIAAVSILVTWGLFINVMGILLPITPLWME